jgi:sec-independent protein translocase protein TatA
MGLRDLFEGSHALILILVIVVLFGWKRLPEAARGLGRSMRIFKSEMDEMKSGRNDSSGAAPSPSAEDQAVHRSRKRLATSASSRSTTSRWLETDRQRDTADDRELPLRFSAGTPGCF